MGSLARPTLLLSILLALSVGGCALAVRQTSVADLKRNPARYHDRVVAVRGVVTTSWGVPLAPFAVYRIDDGTGELTVVSSDGVVPTRGVRVRVHGRVDDLATVAGQPIGLHLRQERLLIKGN